MSTISDVIENFILSSLGSSSNINLSRNELADYFNCAPSQINYVLTTRFNLNRGFLIESQRGGGGYIKLVKIKNIDSSYLYKIIDGLGEEISFKNTLYILEDLVLKNFLDKEQAKIISYSISDKALNNPFKLENKLRVNILKNILVNILKEGKNNE